MKYLEELNNGDKFIYNNNCYLITSDYKNYKEDIQRLCIDMHRGNTLWLMNNTIIEQIFVFYQNKENILIEIKNEKNN
jgi:hypothetical protein